MVSEQLKTKLAFVFGPWSSGDKTFDFKNLLDSSQGLTGSEIGCFYIAREMAKRGYVVNIFAPTRNDCHKYVWDGVQIQDLRYFKSEVKNFDVVYAWNEPDVLRDVPESILRINNHQIADFNYCKPGWDNCVDIFTSPSESHMKWMVPQTPSPSKWCVVPNGWEPSMFSRVEKIRGRVIYASSPDRGLHWLLQEWPRIRKEVPNATLHIFYNFDSWVENTIKNRRANPGVLFFKELNFRALYIKEAIQRLENHGVVHYKEVSRNTIALEFGKAECLAYPCDPVRYTETFCVTAIEGCATGAIPVLTRADALGDIFGNNVPIVDCPVDQYLNEFTDLVVKSLTSKSFQDEWRVKGFDLAQKMTWSNSADHLEPIIKTGLKRPVI